MNESGMRMKGIMETSYEAFEEHNSEIMVSFSKAVTVQRSGQTEFFY